MKGDKNNVQKRAKDGSFPRVVKALSPLPYFGRAHDFYVRSLNKWATGVSSATTLHKSFSTTSARRDDEYGELLRAASQRRTSSSNLGSQRMASSEQALARSRSAAPSVGTIYEDQPCYFPATLPKTVSLSASRYPRSRTSSTPYNFHHK